MDSSSSDTKDLRDIIDLRFDIQREGEQLENYHFVDFMDYGNLSEIPVASDFVYDRFREGLQNDLQIPLNATLYPPQNSGVVKIEDKSSCLIALTQIQGSDSIDFPGLDRLSLPLTHNPSARPSTPQGNKAVAPTVDSPGNISDDESINTRDDESDDGYDDRAGSDNDIRNFPFDWSHVDDSVWADAVRFFCCELDATKIQVEGIKVDIEPYQALAIYKALIQVTTGRSSFIIGDDVGFGKTGISFCIATIFFLLHRRYLEVQEEWDNPPTTGAKHRAEGSSDQICPSQGGIQCPCCGGIAEEIVHYILDFPTLIITPPGLIPSFVAEADKWIDTSPGSPASPVTIHVAHSSFKKSENFLSREKTDLIRASKPNGKSQHIVIMSPAGISGFLAHFRISEFRLFTYDIRAGFVFFDEFHTYRGDRARLTGPFRMLETISAKRDSRTIAIGLSGSARANAAYWRPFIRHSFNDQAPIRNLPVNLLDDRWKIAGLAKLDDFDDYERSWNGLVNTLNDTTLQGDKLLDRNERRDFLIRFLERFVPAMMISRQRGDKFRGVTILSKSRTQLIRCDTQGGIIKDIFGNLISHVKMLVDQEYNISISQWIGRNREGDKPVKRAIAQRRLEFMSDRPRGTTGSLVPQLILRSSTFPAVAQLVHDKSVNYEAILGQNVLATATKISRILGPMKIDNKTKMAALDALKSSIWYQHRDLLYEQSPKIREVERQINTLIDISSKDTDDPSLINQGPPPSDGSNIRHLLLYADYPLSAFLMLLVLFTRFLDSNIVFLYAHSGVDIATRKRYIDYMQEDCQKGDPVKILISTMNIIGHGFNLFRVNNVVITEVSRSWDRQNRAFGRVDRRGQVMQPNLIQLYDSFNLVEEVRRIRNENREQLSGVGHDNAPSYPLADIILDKEDNEKVDDKQTSSNVTNNKQAQGGQVNSQLITRYQNGVGVFASAAATEAAARQAFPNLRFRRIPTRGSNDMCGAYAVIGSLQRQFDQQDVPIPDLDELVNAIYGAQGDFQWPVYRNFSPDMVLNGLREWARRDGIPIDFRLGYILGSQDVNDNQANLIKSDAIEGRRMVVVWVYLRSDGDAGHFEAIERVG
ncbi:hypothetical protein FHL15_010047 [Xylaria flabelliformis]|uniref:Helicase C-terminal domain-containing protein n=1 Tax=Xylaria flabelliformis TaxID=2512241 RepID=A0A553HM44_9PEZI|nr:hypothetical protein FHL15_010047 [Xylaria flabelliformis]